MSISARPHGIDAALDRLESSRSFLRSQNQLRLLRFLLQEAGQDGAALKEAYIGTVFYQRPANYDPQLDSIVRVNVSRLRQRLQEYYEREGWHDPLRIEIPLGTYVPGVTWSDTAGALSPAPPVPVKNAWISPAILAALVALAPWIAARIVTPKPLRLVVQQQNRWALTPGEDIETDPAISPDGKQMLYVGRVHGDTHFHILMRPYALQQMAGQPLATGEGDALYPAWSPDGTQIAFVHCGNVTCEMERYGLADGSVQLVRRLPSYGLHDDQIYVNNHNPRPVWTPDGRSLIFPVSDDVEEGSRLVQYDLATHAESHLVPGDNSGEDSAAVLSPDGRSIAYLHHKGDHQCVMTFNLKTHEAAVISEGWSLSTFGLTWAPDGQSVVVSSNRGKGVGWSLWNIPVRGGQPSQVVVPITIPMNPVFAPNGKTLMVLNVNETQNLAMADDRQPDKPPVIIFHGGVNHPAADISPDGSELAVLLYIGGGYEVWISRLEKGVVGPARQLTHGLGVTHISSIAWSPNGKRLAISTSESLGLIALVDTATGEVSHLQMPGLEHSFVQSPQWTPDSQSLYVSSADSSPDGIYKVSAGPVPSVKLILDCTARDIQLDGDRAIYYELRQPSGVYRVALSDQAKPELVDGLKEVRVSRNWKIAGGGLYYIDLHDTVRRLHRYDLNTGKISNVSGVLPRVVFMRGMPAYSASQHLLFYSQWSEDASTQITAFSMN